MFYLGLAAVLLATWIPFIPAWPTFIHMWRVDLAASLFLFLTLGYLLARSRQISVRFSIATSEFRLIVIPLAAFIAWSGMSIMWASSWKSAAHHTLVWSEYLIFFLLVRYLVDEDRHLSKLTTVFTIALVLFSIPAIFEFLALTVFGGETQFRGRYAKYGEQIVTLLPLLIVGAMRLQGRRLYAGITAVVLLWLLIYCTAGRVNIFLFGCVMASLAVVYLLFRRLSRYRIRFAVCLLLLIAAPVPLFVFSLGVGKADVPLLDRYSDSTGNAYSRDFRLLMNSVSLEMIGTHPLLGVGADNYGMEFNKFREQYAGSHPEDPNLAYGEVGIVGHAHNEFLQIAAELGLVGVAIFAWFLAGIGVIALRALHDLRNGRSPVAAAAVIGLMMFLASSVFSAYSFRLMQNGLVFFFVLAVAAKAVSRKREPRSSGSMAWSETSRFRMAVATGMAVCIFLGGYSSLRVASVILATRANHTQDIEQASHLYRLGMRLDDENPDVRNNLAMRFFQEDRFAEAVPLLEESIRIGRAQSTDFSYLASARSLAGDDAGAEETFASAARLYPRSAFVLTRYAALLRINGKSPQSDLVFGRALAIDRPAANTWWTIIDRGSQAATDLAFKSSDYKPVMDLQPQSSMYAVLDERHVKHPEERLVFRRR